MSIVKGLVDKLGGSIDVKSEVGVGTQIKLVLTYQLDTSKNEKQDSSKLDLKDKRILLVEDNEINMMVATETLAEARLEIDVARDGLEALAAVGAARPGKYAMILMDMQMPNMDGLEATREIRKLPLARDLPIIAMTANAFNEDRARCFAAGMDDFIAKPVDPEQMFATILLWLRRGSSAGNTRRRYACGETCLGQTLPVARQGAVNHIFACVVAAYSP